MKKLKLLLRALLALDADPSLIAKSFAIGLFISVSPIYGTHTVTVLLLIPLLHLHALAALIGSFLNPPMIAPAVYGLAFALGKLMTGGPAVTSGFPQNWGEFKQIFYSVSSWKDVFIPFVAGCTILGGAAGAAAYFILLRAILRFRETAATS